MDKEKPIRIILVDDHPIVINGIKSLLGRNKGVDIYEVATNGAEALLLLENTLPDLIISDISMPLMDGIELTEVVKKKYPQIKVMLLTAYNEKEILKKAINSGAEGCLLKNSSKKELLNAIERIMDGGYYYGDSFVKIAQSLKNETSAVKKKADIQLSERELQVLELLLKGDANREVAEQLNISYHTVTAHRKNIMKKTESRNISGLFAFAKDNNLLPEE